MTAYSQLVAPHSEGAAAEMFGERVDMPEPSLLHVHVRAVIRAQPMSSTRSDNEVKLQRVRL